jgi:DNA (cytosine-5)-methyltransferase 1
MENVPEMLSKKYWSHFEEARNILTHAGYVIHQSIYNSASFGVPQERFRSLVVAMRKEFTLPEPLLKGDEFLSVRQAIGHLPPVAPGEKHKDDDLHRSAQHRESTMETIRAIPKNGGSRPAGVGPKCLDKVRGFYDVYGRLYWDKPAITITHYARNPASGRYVHPEQDRGLTIREAALLQSFPVGFNFSGSFDSVFKQIGEAVPPKFSCAIAASIFVEMITPPPSKEELEMSISSITEPVSNSFSSVIAGLKMARRTS